MKKLIIIGASGFGKEVLWLAQRLGLVVKGFLDDTPEKQGAIIMGVPVIGKVSDYKNYLECDFVIGVGSPNGRRTIFEKLGGSVEFTTLIDPSAIIDASFVGTGSIICAGVIATVDVQIGKHSIVNLNTTLGHDVKVGDFVTIAPNCSISGNITIGDGVNVGTGATLVEKITIGEDSILGMGSVLSKDLESNKFAVGNPARVIKTLGE
ncbi:acetyltransferase [Thiomicrospira pelophila]|uniref:acetyltransferase n=1 Tax=Thiomicrospira pelophila TaxID=934 RepID=UPI0004A73E3B|nr:acetyltransferase [Thiomicrospira pelophila]